MHVASGPLGPLVVVAVAIWFLARQVLPRRISWLMLAVTPVALIYFGVRQVPTGPVSGHQLVDLAAEIAVGLACGLWQARVTAVYASDGRWYMRGGWRYLLGWVVALCADGVLAVALEGLSGLAGSTWIFLLGGAATWGARTAVLIVRHPEILQAPPASGLGAPEA